MGNGERSLIIVDALV